jgi:hypothetical protein
VLKEGLQNWWWVQEGKAMKITDVEDEDARDWRIRGDLIEVLHILKGTDEVEQQLFSAERLAVLEGMI